MWNSDAISSWESQQPSTSKSTFTATTVTGYHEFKIEGYSLVKGMGPGKYIASDVFWVGGFGWAVYFYPDGKNEEDNANYVSLFIALVTEGANARALFELKLLDQGGNTGDKVNSHFGRVLDRGPCAMKNRGSMWGYKRFFRRTALESSDYLKDDCLLIRCCVGVVETRSGTAKLYDIPLPPSNVGECFGKLLETGEGTDINVEVGGQVFAAHKLMLAARSPVFRAQLFGPMKCQNTNCIKVEEVEVQVFKVLLHFIYWDALPDMQALVGTNDKRASTTIYQHLLVAADRFALDRLRLLCEAQLSQDVAINTVGTTLTLAVQHHCHQLKAVCLRYIALPENLKAVMQTDGFMHFKESCPSVLNELLEHVGKHSASGHRYRCKFYLDRSDSNGRRVKQRMQ